MRRIPPMLPFLPLLIGAALANGCGHFSYSLYYTGLYEEAPRFVTLPGGPLREAYASADGRSLCAMYYVKVRNDDVWYADRWLNISRNWVDEALKKRLRDAEGRETYIDRDGVICLRITQDQVSEYPEWDVSKMNKLKLKRLLYARDVEGGGVLGVCCIAHDLKTRQEELTAEGPRDYGCLLRYDYVMPRAGGGGADIVEFELPEGRRWRTFGGYCVQVFQPFAALLDVITFPWQKRV